MSDRMNIESVRLLSLPGTQLQDPTPLPVSFTSRFCYYVQPITQDANFLVCDRLACDNASLAEEWI